MRCVAARKMISDALDGACPSRKSERMEAHLEACEDCRAYRRQLVRFQEEASLRVPAAPEFWAAFERRVEARLSAADARPAPSAPAFPVRRRWVLAAAMALALAGAGVWYALQGPRAAETAWFGGIDLLDPLVYAAESDPELADLVDREIRASIEAMTPGPDADAAAFVAADPLFWEALSVDELRAVVAELENDQGQGGPL